MPKKPEELTIEEVEDWLDWPTERWHGQCFGVASQIVEQGLVEGAAVYGHYLGPIDKHGYWKSYYGSSFVRHGWILLPDGRVLDPTRFSFENVEPYLYLEHNEKDYDEGGDRFRSRMYVHMPLPEAGGDRLLDWNMSEEQKQTVEILMGDNLEGFNLHRAAWMANLPYASIGEHAGVLYDLLRENNATGWVPIDNWRRAIRDGYIEEKAS